MYFCFKTNWQMQRLEIRNFGPIRELEMEVPNCLVLIGPQASGKSTISKAVYFFKSLRDDLVRFIYEKTLVEGFDFNAQDSRLEFKKQITAKFIGFWGTTKHLPGSFQMKFTYGRPNSYLRLTVEEGFVRSEFSPDFTKGINGLFEAGNGIIAKQHEQRGRTTFASPIALEAEKMALYRRVETLANELFGDDKETIFVPAGRSLLATLSDQLSDIDPKRIDDTLRAFLDRIKRTKSRFGQDMESMVEEARQTTSVAIDNQLINQAQAMIGQILKGAYRSDPNQGEMIFFSPQQFVKLLYSSSGQQESVWILLLIFSLLLDNRKAFIVLEEPEAHLYPEAQKYMVDLITLLANAHAGNQVIITTHSPYILAAFNNLLMAHKVGQTSPGQVGAIVSPSLWLDHQLVGAYFVQNGVLENIIDPELRMIKAEKIDSASALINQVYDQLFDLEPIDA
jgi:predicted ATPase